MARTGADVKILMKNFVLFGARKRFQLQNNSIYSHLYVPFYLCTHYLHKFALKTLGFDYLSQNSY